MNEKIIIATGGTGGHIFPALSLEGTLQEKGYQCMVIADDRFLNFKQKFRSGLNYKITTSGSVSKKPLKFLIFLSKILTGTYISLFFILTYRPKLVISFGGYPSFPTVLAATILNIPIMIHEQNSTLGRANKFFIKKAQIISTAFPNTSGLEHIDKQRIHVLGNPVDKEISKLNNNSYNANKELFNILIIGGSQGAKILSKVIPGAISQLSSKLKKTITITQQCRTEDIENVKLAYKNAHINANLSSFFYDMNRKLSNAHLVIARSGAATISELIAAGKPSILIPIKHSNENHQLLNAKFLENNNAAWVIEEDALSTDSLKKTLTYLLSNPSKLQEAHKKAKSLFIDSTKSMVNLVQDFLSTSKQK